MSLEVDINRMALQEAVSLQSLLALVAKNRGLLDQAVAEKQAETLAGLEHLAPPAPGTGLIVDKSK